MRLTSNMEYLIMPKGTKFMGSGKLVLRVPSQQEHAFPPVLILTKSQTHFLSFVLSYSLFKWLATPTCESITFYPRCDDHVRDRTCIRFLSVLPITCICSHTPCLLMIPIAGASLRRWCCNTVKLYLRSPMDMDTIFWLNLWLLLSSGLVCGLSEKYGAICWDFLKTNIFNCVKILGHSKCPHRLHLHSIITTGKCSSSLSVLILTKSLMHLFFLFLSLSLSLPDSQHQIVNPSYFSQVVMIMSGTGLTLDYYQLYFLTCYIHR